MAGAWLFNNIRKRHNVRAQVTEFLASGGGCTGVGERGPRRTPLKCQIWSKAATTHCEYVRPDCMESAEIQVLDEARDAMRGIARELARFFAATGIAVHDFDHAFRAELIATVSEHIRSQGTEPSVTRMAVMTGLPRSSVEQAIAQRVSDSEKPRTQFSERGLILGLSTLTSLWTSDKRFTAVYGVPRDLALRASHDDTTSLELLAHLAMPGLSFDRVLQALREHDLIEIQGSIARLRSQTVFFRNLDAQVVSHYGRMVSGLMRNLRVNRERRHEISEEKPWNSALIMDRPIADNNVGPFLTIVTEGADRWFRNLESAEARQC